MTLFWGLAAGLTLLALLFVLLPMLRRRKVNPVDENQVNLAVFRQQVAELDADLASGNLDRERHEAARRDLEKELLLDIDETTPPRPVERSGRWAALPLALLVPLLAVGLYLGIGNLAALEPATVAGGTGPEGPPMEELVDRLAKRMASDPDNLDGWVMLARSYLALKRSTEAVQAFEQAQRLEPRNPDVLMGLAESVIQAQGSLEGRPAELVAQALVLEPNHPNALWLSGIIQFQQGRYQAAVEVWGRLQPQLEPGGEDAKLLQDYLREARDRATGQGETPRGAQEGPAPVAQTAPPAEAVPPAAPPTPPAPGLQVEVSLAPELAAQASPEDSLFVFARALQGPPMPLAVARRQVKDLPLSVRLDDGMAMMPEMRLSAFPEVLVGARISKSGNATPQSGDLQGEVKPVLSTSTEPVKVVIDGVRP